MSGVGILGWIAIPPAAVEQALIDLIDVLPSFLDAAWQLLYDAFALWAFTLLVAAVLRRRTVIARDMILASGLALVLSLVLARLVDGAWPELWRSLDADAPPQFPSLRVAIASAAIFTASPHLSRPTRRLGRYLAVLGGMSVALLGAATPTGALVGMLVGVLAAAAVHLALGSCGGRPGLTEVATALDELGLHVSGIRIGERQPAGAFLVHAVDADGTTLVVKVYGRDAYDTQIVARLWRATWYRQAGAPLTLSRLQQAEHEAFLSLLARQAGVVTQEVVTAGATGDGDALLVLRIGGESLADLEPDEITDGMLRELWRSVRLLHDGDIAHGQIGPFNAMVDGESVALVDLSAATVAPTEKQRRTDDAQAIVTSVVTAGLERGLALSHAALGRDGLAAALPYVQMPAMPRALRARVRQAQIDLDDLRARAAEAGDVSPPELEKLRRVTWGSVLQMGLLFLAFSALISGISGLDIDEIRDELAEADWWWAAAGALLAQTPRVAQAVATLGACPLPLPLGPVYGLQLAISYVNLAIPSSAARIAVNVRFFQRQGVPSGSALAIGAVDGFSGFIVQAIILVSMLLFSNASLDLQLDPATSGGPGRLLVLMIVLVVIGVAVVLTVPRLRRAVLSRAAELGREAWHVIRGLRSPRRVGMLFGGNLASELLFALSLGAFARMLGYSVPLGELLLINVSVSLLAGLMPIPGGIGVSEGGLTVGLAAAGVPTSAAFAIAIMYRLASFYLPPVWGWFAFRWLQRNKYL
jgi:uncharacterized membrane protein YbhN (UPF0104 family)/tRNA A-37 threonylcarbamoyl transferase component Bud32